MQKMSTLWHHFAPFWPYLALFGQCGPCTMHARFCLVRACACTDLHQNFCVYYQISLSFKFHTDPSFCCGDIFLTQGTLRYQFVKVFLPRNKEIICHWATKRKLHHTHNAHLMGNILYVCMVSKVQLYSLETDKVSLS